MNRLRDGEYICDEVIRAYCLACKSDGQVVVWPQVSNQIFDKNDFSSWLNTETISGSKLIAFPYLINGNHLTVILVNTTTRDFIYIDPLGETKEKSEKLLETCKRYKYYTLGFVKCVKTKLDAGYEQVNHEVEFVNGETGANSNSIEWERNTAKSQLRSMRGVCRAHLTSYIDEFPWLQNNNNTRPMAGDAILAAADKMDLYLAEEELVASMSELDLEEMDFKLQDTHEELALFPQSEREKEPEAERESLEILTCHG